MTTMQARKLARQSLCVLLALAAMWVPVAPTAHAESPDDVVVFVNREVAVSSVTTDELRQMFLGTRTSWPGGGRILCVNAAEGSKLRETFRTRVLRMSADEEQRYWEEQKVQGKGQEPASFGSTVKAVFRLKGGISYGLRGEVKGDVVKIVGVIKG